MRTVIVCFVFFLISCYDKKTGNSALKHDTGREPVAEINDVTNDSLVKPKPTIFTPVLSFPLITDSNEFIRQLREFSDGDCWYDERFPGEQKISYYRKIKINGSNSEYILLEYDHADGPNVCYPYKSQFLFRPDGKLVETLYALRFELIRIFPDQKPFLLTVTSTARGNGGHQLYKISSDTLENIYEGYTDYEVQTYDAEEDEYVFEPNELKLSAHDINKDGFNDLVFSGKIVLIQGLTKDSIWYDGEYSIDNPFNKLPIRYVFLYDKRSRHFRESKKYSRGNPFKK
jgi:hypothetical protein